MRSGVLGLNSGESAEHPSQSRFTAILSNLRRSVLSGEDAEGKTAGRTEAVRPDGRQLRAEASLRRQRWERSGIEDDTVSPAPNRSTANAVVGALQALPNGERKPHRFRRGESHFPNRREV